MIVTIEPSTRKNKRYVAVFKNGKKTHFGLKSGSTYNDHKDKKKRDAYRKRHAIDLKTNDPYRAGFLSYYLLWGDTSDLQKNVKQYNKMFFAGTPR